MIPQQKNFLATESSPRRDDAPQEARIYAACAIMFAVSAALTVYLCRSMSEGMEMPGGWTMSMMWMRMPGQTWTSSTVMFVVMWLAMMIAMMLPSIIPMLLNFRRVRCHQRERSLGLATLTMAGGYFFVWLMIGLCVYAVGIWFGQMTMHSERVSKLVPAMSGLGLILCGLFNFTPLKMSRLKQCRDPQACSVTLPGRFFHSAWRCGISQGSCCAICTCDLMLSLLILGACNWFVMLVVTAVVAMEKIAPNPVLTVRISGLAMSVTGLTLLARL